MIETVEAITNTLDIKQYAAGIFIDLKKEFHTVIYSILLSKLQFYGIILCA